MIYFDVETTGVQWYAHELFLFQALDSKTDKSVVLRHPRDHVQIQAWLNQKDRYCAWNSHFDLHALKSAGYSLPNSARWHDGMIVAHLLDSNSPLALKKRAAQLFGEQERDPEVAVQDWLMKERRARRKEHGKDMIYPNYKDVPAEIMFPYALADCYLVSKIMDRYGPDFDMPDVYRLERDVMVALFDAECLGIPFDREAALAYREALERDLVGLEARCYELADTEAFNPRSSPKVYAALESRGADLSRVENRSMDVTNLQTVDDELAEAVLALRGESKNLNTYVKPLFEQTWKSALHSYKAPFLTDKDRVHPNFRQLGARTARMSCADPNFQNLPRDDLRYRYLVKASEGKKLISADLDSVELRIFAALAGEGALLTALLNGSDLHSQTAVAAGLKDYRRRGSIETARQRGKTLNYAIIYGAGAKGLMKAFDVSRPEAKSIIKRYHHAYPEVGRLQDNILDDLRRQGYVESLWGRKFRSEDPEQDGYKFTNYLVQGTAAELIKVATVRLHKQGVPVIAVVHDEILAEVDESEAEWACELIREAMVNHPRITKTVPLLAEAKILDRWSDAKDPNFCPSYLSHRIRVS